MKIEVKINCDCKEPKIIIETDRMTDEINGIIKKLSDNSANSTGLLTGFRGDTVQALDMTEIIRVYSGSGKVFAVTSNGEYTLKIRLYEAEERLDGHFVRISNSEIINIKKAKNFDLSFVGTICVRMCDNSASYVSRRYVAKIKQILGI